MCIYNLAKILGSDVPGCPWACRFDAVVWDDRDAPDATGVVPVQAEAGQLHQWDPTIALCGPEMMTPHCLGAARTPSCSIPRGAAPAPLGTARLLSRVPPRFPSAASIPHGPHSSRCSPRFLTQRFSPPAAAGAGAVAALDCSQAADDQLHRELHSLNVAITANILIFIAKAYVHVITGSSSILAEALHSVADVLNQLLLRIGVTKSLQAPTTQFPYGYLRDRFVWSLISAVGIFFLGAGASVLHGVHSLFDTRPVQGALWTFVVLAVSALLEGFSLLVAVKNIMAGAKARGLGFLAYVTSGEDPTTVAVLMEDGGALIGLAIAGACTALTHWTGNSMWDAAGSICIGLLLGAIASFLVSKNRQLLLGRSMSQREVAEVMGLLKRDPVVSYVLETKTEEIGPHIFRFKAEVAWDGERLAGRYLTRIAATGGRERLERKLKEALADPNPKVLDKVLKGYGRDIISAVGAEVDRIETDIQQMNPGIRYVDLETDRGRTRSAASSSCDADFDPGPTSREM